MKSPAETVVKTKRWTDTRGIQASSALYMTQPTAGTDDSNGTEEWGDFQNKEDKEYRLLAEKEKPKIYWGCERRCYLNQTSNNA
jgi:hypothetical protein